MPHFGIHLITLDKTIEKLRDTDEGYARFFEDERNMIMARWGAIGPDIFFWSFYEKNRGIEAVENTLFLGYRIMEPFEKIKEILEPIGDDEEELRDFITGGVYQVIEQMDMIISSLKAVLIGGVVGKCFDFVSWFELALAKGQNEPDWYWFDMLHYRNTGEFAKNLLLLANEESNQKTREMLIAYALGYMTHLSTDILGHPYVNRFCGGPYRTQWHRHLLGENCMDTWAWDQYTPDIGEPQVNGIRNEIAFAGIHETFEQGNSRLDENILRRLAGLYIEALNLTYPDNTPHPGIINRDQMLSLFKFMREYLEKATTQSLFSIPEPEEPVVFPALDELFEAPPNIPNPANPDADWEDVFRGIVAFISWGVETVTEALLLPAALSADLVTFVLLRWWLYRINLLLYDLYRSVRLLLVLEGYILPFSDEILDPAVGTSLRTFRHQPPFSQDYPRKRNAPFLVNPVTGERGPVEAPIPPPPSREHQLDYPQTDVETPDTISSPYNENDTPSIFIESANMDFGQICRNLRRYARCFAPFQPQVPDPLRESTEELNKELLGLPGIPAGNIHPLGGAPDLGAVFIAKALNDLNLFTPNDTGFLSDLDGLTLDRMDFNLDGDRGFGWKCWRAEFQWDPPGIDVQRYIRGDE